MGSPITRRDFLNGVAVGVGGAMAAAACPRISRPCSRKVGRRVSARADRPARIARRSFEALHAMRDGAFWKTAPAPQDTREEYDLVVVGAGISGLAAAHFFRKARPDARILLLDNHDDFGGHAKRNEFAHNGRTYIGYGGTQSIDSPAPYSAVAKALITELGIDVARYSKVLDSGLYKSLGLRPAFFFDKETFGADRLVVGDVRDEAFLAAAPLSDSVRRDLKRLLTERFDPMPGLSSAEKKARLARMSYTDFVTKLWKLDPGVLRLYQTRTHGLFGVGVDAVPAQDAFALGLPGFAGMGLDPGTGPGQNYDSISSADAEDYYFHFPDGNASVARLLVRRLVPGAIPGSTMDDVVTARADYAKLDAAGCAGEDSLEQPGDARAPHRVRRDRAGASRSRTCRTARSRRVSGRAVVLACWHTVIPSICPELPAAQKTALDFAIKVPLVYTNVFIRSWTAFQKLGVQRVSTPGMWHTSVGLDFPVSLGAYKHQTNPAEPIVLHLSKAACKPGLAGARAASRRPRGVAVDVVRDDRARAFAISWAARSAAADSIRRPTSSASP